MPSAADGHPRAAEIDALRAAILEACPELGEHVKWNAPSFHLDGDDRITFRLQPGDRVELVLHRGARRRGDVAAFRFDDPTGLVRWAAPDRGVVAFVDAAEVEARLPAVRALAQAWIGATRMA